MIFAIGLLVMIGAAGYGGFLIGQNWHRAGSLSRYPSGGPIALVKAAQAALSALETPGDLTKDELGYVINDLDTAIRAALGEE